jgi:Protein of unknown function (DUF3035)
MQYGSKQVVRAVVLAAGAVALMGCQTFREASGLTKDSPDEFAVVTKAPLVMPPDYNLRPPRDGAPPTNQVNPTDSAQAALFDANDPNAPKPAAGGDTSESEKQLLAAANATSPDPSIRQQVASDGRSMEASSDAFTNKVLFWQDKAPEGTNVDADAEAKRMDAQKNGGQPAATIAKKKKTNDSATIDKKDDDKGGWFDWF